MGNARRILVGTAVAALFAGCGGSTDSDTMTGMFGVGDLPPDSQSALVDAGTGPGLDGAVGPGPTGEYTGGSRPLDQAGIEALRDSSCAGWSASPEPMPSIIMLVVDVSGSMNREDPTDPSQTKWEVTQPALQEALAALPASTAVGLLFYPNMATTTSTEAQDSSFCVDTDELIPIDLLGATDSSHRAALDGALGGTDPNNSAGTPTHDAYTLALAELEQTDFVGAKYMLVITDGQPTFSLNCLGTGRTTDPVDEQPIVGAIDDAYGTGIRTFLIGSPGSEENVSTGDDARPWLSQAAEAGGTASSTCAHDGNPEYCHFDMTEEADFGTGLRNALAEIAGQIVQCDYTMPTPPAGETLNPEHVNVVFTPGGGDPILLLRDDDPACTEGWKYTQDMSHVEMCADTCNEVQSDPDASLELMFGCATETQPIE